MDEKDYKCEDWQRHYEENDLGWDLGQVAPPFVKLWQEEKLPLGKVLVPGCGRGHEVVFLAENGFDVTAIDFSSGAVTYLKNALKKRNLEGRILHQDFSALMSPTRVFMIWCLSRRFFAPSLLSKDGITY